jgi:hypothetical protein
MQLSATLVKIPQNPMEHRDAELSDIEVVLEEEPGITTAKAAEKLTSLGLCVSNVDHENCIIEGTIDCAKVNSLKSLDFVKYVRVVFNYIADYPPGDPRNCDPDNEDKDPESAV